MHFVGIGGAGMTGLALILADHNVSVSGSDEAESGNTRLLRSRGMVVTIGHSHATFTAPDLVVYSSAIGADNPELIIAQNQAIPTMRRGEFLARIAAFYSFPIAIAGSHGKSTVTAMVAHILRQARYRPGYLVGAEICQQPFPAALGSGKFFVTEVDESDGTQALLKSKAAIITNIDDDHYWSLGGKENLYRCFYDFACQSDHIVTSDTPTARAVLQGLSHVEYFPEAAIFPQIELQIPGRHNRLNAALAITLTMRLGLAFDAAITSLKSFAGVDRRLTLRFRQDNLVIIEDYAHHPAEIHASIDAVRESYPHHHLTLVFQPHRYERVKRYGEDFSRELSRADTVLVTTPFEAWIKDGCASGAREIVDRITAIPATYHEESYSELARTVISNRCLPEVIMVMGAGTISHLVPVLLQVLKTTNAHVD